MRPELELTIPVRTFIKIFAAILFALLIVRLVPFLVLFFFAVLIAMTLFPLASYLKKKKFPSWLANGLVALILVAFISFLSIVLIPAVIGQVSILIAKLPELQKDLEGSIHSELLQKRVHAVFENPGAVFDNTGKKLEDLGSLAMSGVYEFLLLIVLSVYLMIEGSKTFQWLVVYFSHPTQLKIKKTVKEIQPVIIAYIGGQAITCVLIGIFIFLTHQYLKVPGALMLGVLAMICDIVPVLGFIISISVSSLLALTVSPDTALIVVALHISYMLFENNVLVPKIYGSRMKISSLAVLISILAANLVAGIAGMVMILPIVASYPIIERIWLNRYVGESTIDAHQKQLDHD